MPSLVSSPSGIVASTAALLVLSVSAPVVAQGIEPHEAVYVLSLSKRASDGPITAVGGTMVFRWERGCEGWSLNQRYDTLFGYADGNSAEMSTTFSSFESLDGLEYSYSVIQAVADQVFEERRGRATLAPDRSVGIAQIRLPEERRADLAPDTYFPTHHTRLLLEAARADRVFVTADFFDGTTDSVTTEVSAVISAVDPEDRPSTDVFEGALDIPGWLFQLAYFEGETTDGTPDVEVAITMFENGVADPVLFQYPDFEMRAALKELTFLPVPEC